MPQAMPSESCRGGWSSNLGLLANCGTSRVARRRGAHLVSRRLQPQALRLWSAPSRRTLPRISRTRWRRQGRVPAPIAARGPSFRFPGERDALIVYIRIRLACDCFAGKRLEGGENNWGQSETSRPARRVAPKLGLWADAAIKSGNVRHLLASGRGKSLWPPTKKRRLWAGCGARPSERRTGPPPTCYDIGGRE